VADVVPLFAEPERNYNLPGFPSELVKDMAHHNGLHYTYIGDDGECLILLGHPERAALDAFLVWLDEPYADATATYARLLHECPDHKQGSPDEVYCRICNDLEPGAWWLDWESKSGPDANSTSPGYFPITVCEAQ
jgi:hypothetical protein